ncbi:MAG: phosphatidate cytidylyltransferase [Eubacteriales bacterium]
MFKDRLVSGIALVIVALVTVIMGGVVLAGLLMIISIIGMSEIYKIEDVNRELIGYIGYIGAIVYYVLLFMGGKEYSLIVILATLILMMAGYVFAFPRYHSRQVIVAFFGFVYVAVMLSCIYLTRTLSDGVFVVWLAFFSSWGCDTCAYCVGVLFGKHKMAPILSPKKSIEGAIGGVIGAAILGAIYAICIRTFSGANVQPTIFAIICASGGLISMIGDLAASGIKRDNHVKDYGTLIPGHGGILDRFDSIIFTAPIIYYLSLYLI